MFSGLKFIENTSFIIDYKHFERERSSDATRIITYRYTCIIPYSRRFYYMPQEAIIVGYYTQKQCNNCWYYIWMKLGTNSTLFSVQIFQECGIIILLLGGRKCNNQNYCCNIDYYTIFLLIIYYYYTTMILIGFTKYAKTGK